MTERPVLSLVGYERHGRFFWNLPVARLSIFRGFITIQPTADWLRIIVPPWRPNIGDLTVVESVRNGLWRGVRLRSKTGEFRIFYCSTSQQADILDAFAKLGVPVDREPQKVFMLDPGI